MPRCLFARALREAKSLRAREREPGQLADAAETMGRGVYVELRRRLMFGELLPGARLTLRGVAAELGTSVQPVREAIGRLAAEEALEFEATRRIVVPRLDRQTADDLWSVRVLLEGDAAASFAQRAAGHVIEALLRSHESRMRALEAGEVAPTRALQFGIGHKIADGCGSSVLRSQIRRLHLRAAPQVAEALARAGRGDAQFARFTLYAQRELLEAVAARDGLRSSHLRRANLLSFQRHIYRLLGWA